MSLATILSAILTLVSFLGSIWPDEHMTWQDTGPRDPSGGQRSFSFRSFKHIGRSSYGTGSNYIEVILKL